MIGGTKRMCEEFVLSNGLRVVAEPIENYPSVSVGLWIGAGSMYESAEENGLSHFVEHILFKSTANRTTKQIAVEMDALGGQVNAFTAKECTCYYAKVIAEHLPRAMDLLCDMLLNARVDEAEFEKERGVILEEIAMCEDTPEDLVYDLLAEAYFGGHPLARPILGSHDQIASIGREALLTFKKKHYRPDNTVLAIAGQFDRTQFREMAERLLGGWHAEGETHIPAPAEGTTPRVLTRKKDIEQVHMCLAFPGVEQDNDALYPISVMNNLFGGGMSSRLFQTVRERQGLCYNIYTYGSCYDDIGVFCVSTAQCRDTEEQAITSIRREIDRFVAEGATQEELNRARELAKANVLMGLESTTAHMNHLARSMLQNGQVLTPDEIIAAYDAVTLEDLSALARETFRWEQASLSVVGKTAEEEQYRKLLC